MSAPIPAPAPAPLIVALGDLVLDLITIARLPIFPGQHQETPPIRPEPGGGCNFLIAGAHIGARMAALGAVGWDVFGQMILDALRAENIDTSGVFIAPDSSTAVVYDLIDPETHQHTFIGGYAQGDMMAFTGLADELIQACDAVFLQGYTLLERQLPELVTAALGRARDLNKPIYFDVGPPSRAVPTDTLLAVLRQVDTILLTADELPIVAPDRDEAAACAYLFSLGITAIVIKRGAAGCSVITPITRHDAPGFSVPVVDTVGAGDCFDAAFIYARQRGESLERAAVIANAMGAACVQKVAAGRNAPTRDEIAAVLTAHGHSESF